MEHTISQAGEHTVVCSIRNGDTIVEFHVVLVKNSYEKNSIWSFYKGDTDIPPEVWAVVRIDKHAQEGGDVTSTASFVVGAGSTSEEAKAIAQQLAHPEG